MVGPNAEGRVRRGRRVVWHEYGEVEVSLGVGVGLGVGLGLGLGLGLG